MVTSHGDVTSKTPQSQIAFRRRGGFPCIWLSGLYLVHPRAEAVVSIMLDRALTSPRLKESAHPSAGIWSRLFPSRSCRRILRWDPWHLRCGGHGA
jgi:hypothetical protein